MSIAALAELAGTSTATVSRALSGKAGVSPATRERIQALAERHGYRPNIVLAEVAAKRFRPNHRQLLSIALLVRPPESAGGGGLPRHIINGHRKERGRWRKTGFDLELVNTWEHPDPAKLGRRLYNEGFQGVLLCHIVGVDDYLDHLDLSPFAVISQDETETPATYHMVRSSQFRSYIKLYHLARSRGYRRVGAAIFRHTNPVKTEDMRLIAADRYCQGEVPSGDQVEPLIFDRWGHNYLSRQLGAWLHREKPDAIIAQNLGVTEALGRPPGLGICVLASGAANDLTGFHFEDRDRARQTISLMDTLIRSGSRGMPDWPLEIVTHPVWRPGTTLPPREGS